MAAPHLWQRAETKAQEHRVCLTPTACAALRAAGFQLTCERSYPGDRQRCIGDEEYARVGCTMAEPGSWKDAPRDALIVGLKELPDDYHGPLVHRHIFFAHCFKGQAGWTTLMQRFMDGGGCVLDLEFLHDDLGRRVAAFGHMAGFAGCALGLDAWCQQQLHPDVPLPPVSPYANEEALIDHIRSRLECAAERTGARAPRVHVMGALGRCGQGACELARKVGLPDERIIQWDLAETKAGGPFAALLESDILVNCIYLSRPIPPFITTDMMKGPHRLSVVVDVSCDTTNPNNPLPFYTRNTSFIAPCLRLEPNQTPSTVDVIAIDHLPTLLPLESSQRFAHDLLPTMLELKNDDTSRVWQDAKRLFDAKAAECVAARGTSAA